MPTSSTEKVARLDAAERSTLLDLARRSIDQGLSRRTPLRPSVTDYPPQLQAPGASFVTIHLDGQLRGCIGTLSASRALVADVAEHAWAAAFEDPRFPPVSEDEAPRLDIHISVLSNPEPMTCEDEDDLIAQLRPGIDGLILEDSGHRATFLPAVWADLQDPRAFLRQLKLKAALPPDHWSPTLRFSRYTTETFPE